MLGGYNIYKRFLRKSEQVSKQIERVRGKLEKMPEGKLICCKGSWYQSDGHKKVYIKKQDRKLAEKLAAKKYLSALLEDLETEKYAMDLYMRHCIQEKSKVDTLIEQSPDLLDLLSPYFAPLSKELDDWMKSPYEKNLKHPEHLTHKVGKDEYVRSKSEAMIAKLLRQNKIPYRYECQMILNDVELYPDFIIRHPKTGKMYIWEHFGRLDKPNYVRNMHSKMQIFTSNNYMPGINLITTYETKDNPLSHEMVELLINYYFL